MGYIERGKFEPNSTLSCVENLDSGKGAIVKVTLTRNDFVADEVPQMVWDRVYAGKEKQVMGVYRLTMKSKGDEFRTCYI